MSTVNPVVRQANVIVRRTRPLERPDWEFAVRRVPVAMFVRPRRTVELTFIYFRSFGCRFDRAGECSMCNYAAAERVTSDRITGFVAKALGESDSYDALGISPFGNMFDPVEVPEEARRRIFEMAAATDCTSFSCESRPETFDGDQIDEAVAIFGGRPVFVNIGLESAHPWIQANCVGKSLDLSSYQSSVSTLTEHGARPITNLLLGAPFLTEREAIQNSASSIRWALGQGSYLCVLFPSNVKGFTLQEWLWQRGAFQVPSLWSLIAAIREVGPVLAERVRLSWFSASVSDAQSAQISDPVRAVPTTCPECHDDVVSQLSTFNAIGDFAIIDQLAGSSCRCRSAWERMISESAADLRDRVADRYGMIAREMFPDWWERHGQAALDALDAGYAEGGFHPAIEVA
jgi:radical SAM enzyme (TIGR01210 family)